MEDKIGEDDDGEEYVGENRGGCRRRRNWKTKEEVRMIMERKM